MLRPIVNLSRRNGVHECRFSDAVLSHQRIAAAPQQPQFGIVQQNLASVGQIETQITQFHTSIVVFGVPVRFRIVLIGVDQFRGFHKVRNDRVDRRVRVVL
jgi:hypothetical protein